MTKKGSLLAALIALVVFALRVCDVLFFIDPATWLPKGTTDWLFIAAALVAASGAAVFLFKLLKPLYDENSKLVSRSFPAAAGFLLASLFGLAASAYTLYHAVYTIALVGFSRLNLALRSAYGVAPFSFWLGVAASVVGFMAAFALFIAACSYYRGNRKLFSSKRLLLTLSAWYLLRTLWEFLGRSLNPHNSVYAMFLISTAALAAATIKYTKYVAYGNGDGRLSSSSVFSAIALFMTFGLAAPTLWLFARPLNMQMLLFEASDVFAALALYFAAHTMKGEE